MIHDDVLGTIRDAWPVRLRRLPGDAPGSVVVAMAAPGTSPANADALAAGCLADLERSGSLATATTLVSYGATFGASVAMAAAVRGLGCVVVVDEAASQPARNRIRAYGAELRVIPVRGASDESTSMYLSARRIAEQSTGAVLVEKRRTEHGPTELRLGEELVASVGADLCAIVGADRDALALAGVRQACEHAGHPVAVVTLAFDGAAWSGHARGVPLLVSERDALVTARRLAAEEGILAGAAVGGATVAAALRLAADAEPGTVVLALAPAADRGDLITTFDEAWWNEHHGRETSTTLTAVEILGHKDDGPSELVTLAPDATVVEAIRIMRDLEVSQIPVLRDDRIVGTIREDQVIDLLLHAPERKDGPVEAVMEDPLPEIDGDASVDELQSLLVRGGSAVIVRLHDGGRAILTKYDLIHALTRG